MWLYRATVEAPVTIITAVLFMQPCRRPVFVCAVFLALGGDYSAVGAVVELALWLGLTQMTAHSRAALLHIKRVIHLITLSFTISLFDRLVYIGYHGCFFWIPILRIMRRSLMPLMILRYEWLLILALLQKIKVEVLETSSSFTQWFNAIGWFREIRLKMLEKVKNHGNSDLTMLVVFAILWDNLQLLIYASWLIAHTCLFESTCFNYWISAPASFSCCCFWLPLWLAAWSTLLSNSS